MNETALTHGGDKIQASHRLRLACIYIRQSSPSQLRDNKESLRLQYQLLEKAERRGWSKTNIRIIDDDLGTSGRSSEGRLGFQELVNLVSLGKVGIIVSYEVSRFARNNADWYHLLNLAALCHTLVVDNDDVYDPNLPNDRLLLGLKGAISEFELHSIRQRMDAGRMNKIKRGEYRQPLPTGYVRLRDGTVTKDPDEQVRSAVQLVFDKFVELGSVSKVGRYLRKNQILLPRRQSGGLDHGELRWRTPEHSALYAMLTNPAYAGAFAHGRWQTQPNPPGQTGVSRTRKPIEEWVHLQQNVYPAYLTWEQFLAIQEQIRQNSVQYDQYRQGPQGAAREGSALLQGLVWCGVCGARLNVRYTQTVRYACNQFPRADKGSCLHTVAAKVDDLVVTAFFQAIQPAQLDALALCLEQQQQEQQQLDRQWQQRLERTRYEAKLAEKRYRSVDPENRLVAATLETQWEETLRHLQETRDAYEQFCCHQQTAPHLSPELQEQFHHLGATLPTLWPQLANEEKKLLLRTLILQVILTPAQNHYLEVKIVWVSGHYSTFTCQRTQPTWEERPQYPALLARIHTLWQQGIDDAAIATQLNAEGFPAFYDQRQLSRLNVRNLRLKQGWSVALAAPQTPPLIDGHYTLRGLALACGTSHSFILTRIHDGTIPPELLKRHPHRQAWLIRAADDLIPLVQASRQRLSQPTRSLSQIP